MQHSEHSTNSLHDSTSSYESNKKTFNEVTTFAAKWWAQFLPGINQAKSHYKHVTQEEYNEFVETLSEKISALESKGIAGIQLGNGSSYDAPKEVTEALKKISKILSLDLFPYKTQMNIFEHRVSVNGKIIFVDSSIELFNTTKDLDQIQLSNSPKVKLKKNFGFRILNLKPEEGFYTAEKDKYSEQIRISKLEPLLDAFDDQLPSLHLQINAKDINGGNDKLCNLPINTLKNILRNPNELHALIKPTDDDSIYMPTSSDRGTFLESKAYADGSIGKIHYELLDSGTCYRESSNSVQLLSLPAVCIDKTCAIGRDTGIHLLQQKEYIVAHKDGSLNYYDPHSATGFSAYLCTNDDCSIVASAPLLVGNSNSLNTDGHTDL
jgi:hypothetical protein